MQSDWMTLATLGTFAGATFAVGLITQFIKGALDRLVKMPTQLVALLIAWLVLLGRTWVMDGGLPMGAVYLDLLNGFMVALAAIGGYEVIARNTGLK